MARGIGRSAISAAALVALLACGGPLGCGSTASSPSASTAAAPTKPVEKTVPIVYTTSALAAGRVVVPGWLEVREVPESQVDAGLQAKKAYFEAVEEAAGMTAIRDLDINRPLLRSDVRLNVVDGLSDLIVAGRVAIALPTNAVMAMPFLRQGDRVDVIGQFLAPRRTGDRVGTEHLTKIVLSNIKVLAVHLNFSPGSAAKKPVEDEGPKSGKPEKVDNPYLGASDIRSVTLEVTPQQAQLLALATDMTKLQLAAVAEGSTAEAEGLAITDASIEGEGDTPQERRRDEPVRIFVQRASTVAAVSFSPTTTEDYDEDADAPLWQDGHATGVRPRGGEVAPQTAPLPDEVYALPSLPDLPDSPE